MAKPRGSVVGRIHNAAERVHAHHPSTISGTSFSPRKGAEVEAKIGTNGLYRRAVVVKTPKHGRWHNGKIFFVHYDRKSVSFFFYELRQQKRTLFFFLAVMDDVSKKVIKRVPSSLIRQVSSDGAKDVEIHGGDPEIHSGMKRKFEIGKGKEIEAQIGNSKKYRKCVITKVPYVRCAFVFLSSSSLSDFTHTHRK